MEKFKLDEQSTAFFLDVPGSKVVLLQAIFETYEGVALVRTLDVKNSLVAIVTTNDFEHEVLDILNDIKENINWRPFLNVPQEALDNFEGFWKKGI